MTGSKRGNGTHVLRYVARALSTLLGAVILVSVVIDGYNRVVHQRTVLVTQETIGIGAYCLFVAVGVGLSWWKEGFGGAILTLVGLLFTAVVLIKMESHDYWISLVFGLPFLLSGVLFLLCWEKTKSRSI